MQREKTLPMCSGEGETGHAELLIDVQQMSPRYTTRDAKMKSAHSMIYRCLSRGASFCAFSVSPARAKVHS